MRSATVGTFTSWWGPPEPRGAGGEPLKLRIGTFLAAASAWCCSTFRLARAPDGLGIARRSLEGGICWLVAATSGERILRLRRPGGGQGGIQWRRNAGSPPRGWPGKPRHYRRVHQSQWRLHARAARAGSEAGHHEPGPGSAAAAGRGTTSFRTTTTCLAGRWSWPTTLRAAGRANRPATSISSMERGSRAPSRPIEDAN